MTKQSRSRKRSKKTTKNIIILHGWGSSPERWQPIYDSLATMSRSFDEDLNIFVPFLPGFDSKKPLTKPFTVRDYALWLNDYIKSNAINSAMLVGHSNGGRIAIYYLSHFNTPEKSLNSPIEKLVLYAAAGISDPKRKLKRRVFGLLASWGKTVTASLGNKRIEKTAQKLLYKAARESDYLRATPVMKETMKNILQYDVSGDLEKISIPTLCIWGKHDKATPLWMGQTMHKHIKNSRLEVVDGDHNLHISHPGWLSKTIASML